MPNAKRPLLRDLLSAHEKYQGSENSAPKALGDGFLYKNNTIFKNVRDVFLSLGGKYSTEAPFPYFSFPLISLPEITGLKIVPVIENTYWLREIERRRPGLVDLEDISTVRPIRNFLIHESAHCVAHELFYSNSQNCAPNQPTKDNLIKLMVAEAFANTVEELVYAYSARPKSAVEDWILRQNLYFAISSDRLPILISLIGLKKTAKMMILLFIHSNFLAVDINRSELDKILDLLELDRQVRKSKELRGGFVEMKKMTFSLSPTFRTNTTRLFLKGVAGYKKPLSALLNFNPINAVRKSTELQTTIDLMTQVIDGSFEGPHSILKKVA